MDKKTSKFLNKLITSDLKLNGTEWKILAAVMANDAVTGSDAARIAHVSGSQALKAVKHLKDQNVLLEGAKIGRNIHLTVNWNANFTDANQVKFDV